MEHLKKNREGFQSVLDSHLGTKKEPPGWSGNEKISLLYKRTYYTILNGTNSIKINKLEMKIKIKAVK